MLLSVKGLKNFPLLRPFSNSNVVVLPIGEVRLHAGVEFDSTDNSSRLVLFTEFGERFTVFDDVRLNVFSKEHPPDAKRAPHQTVHDCKRGNAVRVMFTDDETRYTSDTILRQELKGFGFSPAVIEQCIKFARGKE